MGRWRSRFGRRWRRDARPGLAAHRRGLPEAGRRERRRAELRGLRGHGLPALPPGHEAADPADQHEQTAGQREVDPGLHRGLDLAGLLRLLQLLFGHLVWDSVFIAELVGHGVTDEVRGESRRSHDDRQQPAEDRDHAHGDPRAPAAQRPQPHAEQHADDAGDQHDRAALQVAVAGGAGGRCDAAPVEDV